MVRFTALYSFTPNEALSSIWIDSLSDLEEQAFERACRKVEAQFKPTSACQFPTPAHIREHVAVVVAANEAVEIETEWQNLLKRLQWAAFDPGFLSERARQAVSAAGGFDYLTSCPRSELQWANKRFIEAYKNLATVENNKQITSAETRALLSSGSLPTITGQSVVTVKTQ